MPLKWRVDILAKLKAAGYSTYKIRQDKIFGQRVVQQLRNGDPVSWEVLSRLCNLLDCQPGDLVEFTKDEAGD